MHFVLHCIDKPGAAALRAANRPAHLEYLKANDAKIQMAGPILSDDGGAMVASLLILNVPAKADAEAFVAGDPYTKAGLFASVAIAPWKQVIWKG